MEMYIYIYIKYGDVVNLLLEFVMLERDFFSLMLSLEVKFSTEFFLGFVKLVNIVIGACCDENVVYIVDVYHGLVSIVLNISFLM